MGGCKGRGQVGQVGMLQNSNIWGTCGEGDVLYLAYVKSISWLRCLLLTTGENWAKGICNLVLFLTTASEFTITSKKKEKNKQQEENAYCYHKKTEVEGEKKVCALAN